MGLGIGVRSFRNVAAEAIGDWSEDIREGQEAGCFWLCHYVYADHDDYCQHGIFMLNVIGFGNGSLYCVDDGF